MHLLALHKLGPTYTPHKQMHSASIYATSLDLFYLYSILLVDQLNKQMLCLLNRCVYAGKLHRCTLEAMPFCNRIWRHQRTLACLGASTSVALAHSRLPSRLTTNESITVECGRLRGARRWAAGFACLLAVLHAPVLWGLMFFFLSGHVVYLSMQKDCLVGVEGHFIYLPYIPYPPNFF